ncbi:unnamed protein product [Rotaria sp. Silwood2]|nr:unnamed protein product [Rotaria sp. Silwood2]CAF2904741.1 unnamed protein product [Rotaria sp. Silwood2]CAF4471848.1 unnamed protein product [Rotaria sp. Silwood2]
MQSGRNNDPSQLPELFIPGDHLSLSAIRTVRILRPLDVIHRVSSMRILVMLLLDTLPMLGNVLLLCFFLSLFIFVVIGVQLWKGLLRNHFFLHLSATSIDNYAIFDDFPFRPFYIPPDQDSFMCSYPSSNRMTKCSDIPSFRQDNMACELDFHTLSSSLTNKAINGFSSIPLINQKHRSGCRYHQSQSLLISTPLLESIDRGTSNDDIGLNVNASTSANNNLLIDKSRRNNENLEFERQEQQIERNDICDCYYQDETLNISDNNREEEEEEKPKFRQKCEIYCCCCCSCFTIIRKLISRVVASKYFDRIIFSTIIITTLSMSIECHGQPQSLTNVLEYSNYVFIVLFTIEMLFKIISEGYLKYINNLFNIFDGGIVLISLIKLYETKHSGLSVLRTFRLLRVLKLVRFMPTLRRQLVS